MRHAIGCAARAEESDLTDDAAPAPGSSHPWPIALRLALGIALALTSGAIVAAVPALGAAELQAVLLAAVVVAALGLGLGAGLAAAAAGFAWMLWPAAAEGTLGTATLLRGLLWFALAKGIAAAIALPRGDLRRLARRLRGTEVVATERALLLEEMSHRIRNDMQRLVGLLQAEAVTNPTASGALLQAAGRIQVLGRVHRRLARRAGTDALDSQAFLEGLVDDLRAALLPETGIALTVKAEAHALPVVVASDLGLVLNELVTNALKYAFPSSRAGVVRVCFVREGGSYRLVVVDNGVGPGQARLAAVEGGSGMRLVRALASQLGGRVYLRAGEVGGTLCSLSFPVAGPGRAMPVVEAPEPAAQPKRRSAAP